MPFHPLPSLSPIVLFGQPRFWLFQRHTSRPDVLPLSRMPFRKLRARHQSPSFPWSTDHALSSTSAPHHLGSSLNPPRGDSSRRPRLMSDMGMFQQSAAIFGHTSSKMK